MHDKFEHAYMHIENHYQDYHFGDAIASRREQEGMTWLQDPQCYNLAAPIEDTFVVYSSLEVFYSTLVVLYLSVDRTFNS